MSPTLAQAVECLAKFFNPGKRTYPSKEDSDSFEVIEMAEVERESPLTEWPRQEPSKDCVTILPHLWGYQIYIPSKVLKSLKEQRLKERAAFISMQLQSQFDGVLSIALPGGNVVPVDNIRAETYIINCWDKIFTFAGGDGVILRASWLTPLVYDLETWEAEPSKVNEEAQKAEPRIKNPVRATSVDDMVMVG
ncbi:hypothetical protein FRC10_001398 [Ceratobasidium sp. 414]|nr:hypothetical protein FRC10_001398 [Ceratobasidium sp. 414]